jgi:hypothetical protein
MKKSSRTLVCLLSLLFTATAFGQEPAKDVKDAAQSWLSLLDTGSYEESWHRASPTLQDMLSSGDWARTIADVRAPFGEVVERELRGARTQQSPPGVPAGEYVMLRFQSQFEHQERALETLTLVRTDDGDWQAVGYFLH